MIFDCAKAENCYAEARTYDYRLPITAEAFCALLVDWDLRENRKFRRPMFTADKDGVNLKGILAGNVIRASFPEARWEAEKAAFESWLGAKAEPRENNSER